MNRFSSDINAIDSTLPEEWNDLFAFSVIICGTLFVISYSTPMFLIMVPPLILVYLWIQDYFIKSSQSLKRMYSVSRSPLYQHFSETLAGASSIRVIDGLKDRFVRLSDERADTIANRMNAWTNNNRWYFYSFKKKIENQKSFCEEAAIVVSGAPSWLEPSNC